jgi:hypothetical protein
MIGLRLGLGLDQQSSGSAKGTLLPLSFFWLEGDSGVTTSVGNVTSWLDQSSSAITCTGLAGNLPTTSTNINGKACVAVSGSQCLTIPNESWAGVKTVAIVCKLSATPGASSFDSVFTMFDGTNFGEVLFMNLGGYTNVTAAFDFTSTTGAGYSPTLDTNAHEYIMTWDAGGNAPGDFTMKQDGSAQTVSVSSTITRSANVGSIGARTNGTSPANGFAGDIAAIIVFKSVLSAANLTLLHSYLNGKYGV